MEFHILLQMASGIHKILDGNAPAITGETYQYAVHGEKSFLDDVISPIYGVLRKVMYLIVHAYNLFDFFTSNMFS